METRQLVLIDTDRHEEWRLDERTRQIGRDGIAAAREALRAARPADEDTQSSAA